MRTLANIFGIALLLAASMAVAYLLIDAAGLEPVRLGLRWVFAPALALGGVAVTMASKVHEIPELKGVTVAVIDRLTTKLRVIEVRLWITTGTVIIAALVGVILSFFVDGPSQGAWLYHAVAAALGALIGSVVFAVVYIPWLQHDISSFRIAIARDSKLREQRDEQIKSLARPNPPS